MSHLDQPTRLRDVMTLDKGKPPAQQDYYGPEADLYLTPDYLRGGMEGEPVKPSANVVFVKNGETIVLWDGSNAGEIFKARKGILASTMTRVDHGGRYDSEYFFYALKRWESYLKGQTSGSGIPHVDKEVLGQLALFEFDKHEQKIIAEVLSTVDQAIEQTEALIAKQQRTKTGLMQDLLTRGIDEHGNLRSEDTHVFKDSPLGRIPVEWSVLQLEDVLSEHPRNGLYKPAQQIGFGTLIVGQTSFTRNRRIDYRLCRRASLTPAEKKSYRLENGDLLVTRVYASVDGVGLPVLVSDLAESTVYESNMLRLRVNHGRIDPYFLFRWLASPVIRRQIVASVNASNQASVNQAVLNQLPVPGIPVPERSHIAEALLLQESFFDSQTVKLSKLQSVKTALMQDLLTGKKRVTPLLDPEDATVNTP